MASGTARPEQQGRKGPSYSAYVTGPSINHASPFYKLPAPLPFRRIQAPRPERLIPTQKADVALPAATDTLRASCSCACTP